MVLCVLCVQVVVAEEEGSSITLSALPRHLNSQVPISLATPYAPPPTFEPSQDSTHTQFMAAALQECLQHDKMSTFPPYLYFEEVNVCAPYNS